MRRHSGVPLRKSALIEFASAVPRVTFISASSNPFTHSRQQIEDPQGKSGRANLSKFQFLLTLLGFWESNSEIEKNLDYPACMNDMNVSTHGPLIQ